MPLPMPCGNGTLDGEFVFRPMRLPEILRPSDEPESSEPAGVVKQRRVVSSITLGVGATLLGVTLGAPDNSPSFYILALSATVVWIAGGLISGPLPLGQRRRGGDVLWPAGIGVLLYGLFVAVDVAGRHHCHGQPALVAAAVAPGTVTALERRSTRGVLAPIITARGLVRLDPARVAALISTGPVHVSNSSGTSVSPGNERVLAVTVLGSGGPIANPHRASSGYIVSVDGRSRIMVDEGRIDQWPASGSRRRPKTDGESNRGTHHQSTEPPRSISTAEWQSDHGTAVAATTRTLLRHLPVRRRRR
jgi:hypothetical protein